jgi:hypothetical protein
MSTSIARIIEPTRKNWATERWRQVAGGRAHRPCGPGPAPLVSFDASTLYFENNAGGGFGAPGFYEERRPDPQTTLGLSAGARRVRRGRLGVRGQQSRDPLDVAGGQRVRVRPQSLRRHGWGADAGTRPEANQIASACFGVVIVPGTRTDGPVLARPRPSTCAERPAASRRG